MRARARLLQKLGDETYAEGLYENVATMREPESPDSVPGNFDPDNFGLNEFGFQKPKRTHSVIALLRLGKIQEEKDTAKAIKTYAKLLREIKNIPANVRSAINLTAGSIEPYDYETRIHHFTGNDLNFNDIEAEANLRMGLAFAKRGHDNHAQLKFSLAAEKADDPLIVNWALSEEAKLRSRISETGGTEQDAAPPLEERKGPSEKVVITHF
jgi:hypothetical protein